MANPQPDETPERFTEGRQPLSPRDEPTLAEFHKALEAQKYEIDAQLTSIMKHLAAGGTDKSTRGWKTELSNNFNLIKGILEESLKKITVRRHLDVGGGGGAAAPQTYEEAWKEIPERDPRRATMFDASLPEDTKRFTF